MKVLIIRPAALGDTILLMPSIARLGADTEITLVGRFPGLEFLRPHVRFCVDYEGSGWHLLFTEGPANPDDLSIPRVENVVAFLKDPEGTVRENLEVCLPEAAIRFFPPFPPKGGKTHAALYLAQCFEEAGLPIDAGKSLNCALERPLLKVEDPVGGLGGIVLHPGSGGREKNHPLDFWIGLMKGLRGRLLEGGGDLILLLGPAEEPFRSFFQKKSDALGAKILFAPAPDILRTVLGSARLFIGQDSGITHLAAMLGAHTIALFKNSSTQQWRPLGPDVTLIEDRSEGHDLIEKILVKVGERLP